MNIVVISYIAAICSMASFVPQVYQTWKTKRTKDISLMMYTILGTGAFLWATYGVFLRDVAIIVTNTVMFVLILPIIFLKIKHG